MDLETAIELFFAERWDLSGTTVAAYTNHLKHFRSFVGNPQIDSISSTDIKKYLRHAATELGLSRRTCSDHWICLSGFFSWAEKELNVKHPIRGGQVERPKFQKKIIEILTEDECKALLRNVGATSYTRQDGKVVTMRRPTAIRDRAIILVLLDAGLRVTELCNLTVQDWSAQKGRLHVEKGKGRYGGRDRNVFIGNACKSAIMRYLATRGKVKQSDPLFATSTGRAMDRFNVRTMLETVAKAAGVRQDDRGTVHPHLLRHTMAVSFLRNGGNLRQLQDRLGHEDMSTVQHYLHMAEIDSEAQAEFSPADAMRL
jgi:site-specific recombinase XerD